MKSILHTRVLTRFATLARVAIAVACLLSTSAPGTVGAVLRCDSASLQVTSGVSIPDPAAYDIEEIASLPGDQSIAYGINNAGQVVGFSMNGAGCCAQAFRFTPPNNTEFWPYGPITYGNAINDAGVIAGEKDLSGGGGGYQAFLSSGPNNVTPLGPLSGYLYSFGLAINGWSEVAGFAYSTPRPQRAVLFSNGQTIDLGSLPGGGSSVALGVNDDTQVVGYAEAANSSPTYWNPGHAFVWRQNSGMLDLNQPQQVTLLNAGAFKLRKATAINNHNQIVGFANPDDMSVTRAYLLTRSRVSPLTYWFEDLGTFPGGGGISYALALNNAGAVVGTAYEDATGAGNYRAALFTHGQVVNLNASLGLYDRLHWLLVEATGINDNGEIVGWGTHDGQVRAFKLTPRAHIEVSGELVVDPPTHRLKAVLTVEGSGFSAQDQVEVEVSNGDTGGRPVKHAMPNTDTSGRFTWSTVVPCATDLAVSAWDRKTGAFSNAGTINISCYR